MDIRLLCGQVCHTKQNPNPNRSRKSRSRSRQTKDKCLIPGGLHSLPERAKGISDDAIWAMQKSAEAIVVVLGNEGLNQQNLKYNETT